MFRSSTIIFNWLFIAMVTLGLMGCGSSGGGGAAGNSSVTKNCGDQPSSPCIEDLSDWKTSYLPYSGDCKQCHTICTPSHNPLPCTDCHKPHKKKSLNCTECHKIHSGLCFAGADWNQPEKRCYKCHKNVHYWGIIQRWLEKTDRTVDDLPDSKNLKPMTFRSF